MPIGRPSPIVTYRYLPDGWDAVWIAAKNASGTTPAIITYWTDSVGQGAYADNWITHGFPGLITANLKARYPTTFAEFWPIQDSTWVGGGGALFVGGPWTLNTTPSAALGGVLPGSIPRWAGDSHPTQTLATFVSPAACTAFDIVWTQHYNVSAGSWTYTVDGGATQTVSYGGGTQSDNLRREQVTGLASTTHTVVLTGQAADNSVEPLGIAVYPAGVAGTGLGYVRACLVGNFAGVALSAASVPSSSLAYQWMGGLSLATPSAFGFPTAPHLLIIELGINDAGLSSGRNLTQYLMSLRKVIETVRLAHTDASIMLIACSDPDPLTTDIVQNGTVGMLYYRDYARALWSLAQEQRCALVDYGMYFGSTPVAKGYMLADNTAPHLTTTGHAAVAGLITPYI